MKQIIIDIAKKEKNLYKLHAISQSWVADLTFLNDENTFLQDLINLHFIDLCNYEFLQITRKLNAKIDKAIKKNNLLLFQIQTHEKQLATLFESDHFRGEANFRAAHKKLAKSFDQHILTNKVLKTRVFTIIKDIMKRAKQKKLLSLIDIPRVDNSKELDSSLGP